MHRTNFGRQHSKRMEKILAAVPMQTPVQAVSQETPSRIVNQVVSRVEDGLMGQLVFLERLETSVTRMRDAMVAITDRVGGSSDSLVKQIAELKTAVGQVAAALKSHMENLANDTKKSLNFGGELGAIRAELAQLAAIASAQKGHSDVLGKLFADQSKSSKASKLSANMLLDAITALNERLDSLENKQATPSTSVDLEPLLEYLRAEKKIIRDSNGDVSGWKVKDLH